jgi:putative NIF3 family GTP cyclohydrolase 1 type 2
VFKSARVERILELSKQYADISVVIEKLRRDNKPVGKQVGDRISTYQKLIVHLDILEALVQEREQRSLDALVKCALGMQEELL